MVPKTIGIVGGAGPLAGVALLKKIFQIAQEQYGCCMDADFPKVLFISYPFTNMLERDVNCQRIANELQQALDFLKNNGASIRAIACNTLHTFLNKSQMEGLISLPEETTSEVRKNTTTKPLVLCTKRTRSKALYDAFFPCVYPEEQVQKSIDELILLTLKGDKEVGVQLTLLVEHLKEEVVLLGCTELSLWTDQLQQSGKVIIDPLLLVAETILKKSFS